MTKSSKKIWAVPKKPIGTTRKYVKGRMKRVVLEDLPPDKLKRFVELVIIRAAKKRGLDKAAMLLATLGSEKLAAKVGSAYANIIQAPEGDFMGSATQVPATSVESSKMLSGWNGGYTSKSHKIRFEAGPPSTSSIRRLRKLFGETKTTQFDTLRTALSDASRAELTVHTGFNQKNQVMFSPSYTGFTLNDMNEIFQINDVDENLTYSQKVYANIMEMASNVRISNINKFLPVTVKIYMVKNLDLTREFSSIIASATNAYPGIIQSNNAMPVYNQLAADVVGSNVKSVLVDPKSNGIISSNQWKGEVEIVRTFTKKLGPGDVLDFDYIHHCGPGLRLDKVMGMWTDTAINDASSVTYLPMFEIVGPPVEAYRADNSAYRYLGTAPGSVNFEFKKTIKGVQRSFSVFDENTGANKGYYSQHFGVRIYSKSVQEIIDKERVENFDFANVVSSAGTSSQVIIPIATPLSSDYVGEKT